MTRYTRPCGCAPIGPHDASRCGHIHPQRPLVSAVPGPIPDLQSPRLAYFAHPVAAETPEGVGQNLQRARRWLRALIGWSPNRSFVASWLPYCEVLPEDAGPNRERGLRDNLAVVARCDEIWLCGPRLSSGMAMELDTAKQCGLSVYNLLGTIEPPARVWPPIAE